MSKMESWKSYHYEPRPLDRKPASKTPMDQTRESPTTSEPNGKFGGLGKKVTGGIMNTGGKRRPGHNARYGID